MPNRKNVQCIVNNYLTIYNALDIMQVKDTIHCMVVRKE
nr:MAG TPA: hypothetical protein [Caudoviricetes sp.]